MLLLTLAMTTYMKAQTNKQFYDMILERVINAPINLFYDVTPIGRI